MTPKIAGLCLLCVALCFGADKKIPAGEAANDSVDLRATLYNGQDAVRNILGSDFGGYVVVVDVRVTPKGGKPLALQLDDFILRSDKDGQRSKPFAPAQLAGRGALVVSSGGDGRGIMSQDRGPVWGGGYPGGGRPRRMGGEGGAIGNTAQDSAQATVRTSDKEKDDPLLASLKEKVLPEKETAEPVAGLLYFLLEGKHKTKQLELLYGGQAGKLSIRFHD